ncbi:hypothetical protein MFLO_04410 [Listeria floridensis FSL S10-1187]|uniref:Uncharacterized protein n=1 Tax=Listeria floridensis FSL S10-1187 TaxID=1265817 RepID=A0ABP3B2E3_9LIST|nr:hypothetical protein MFLO_04410 [Listeria floridensis FSL S10-1187]
MNWLHTNALFDSVTNADKFIHDFHKIVVSDVPLWAVQKDLLYLMEMNETKSFRIPSTRTRDRCDHIFRFEKTSEPSNDRNINVYTYKDYV